MDFFGFATATFDSLHDLIKTSPLDISAWIPPLGLIVYKYWLVTARNLYRWLSYWGMGYRRPPFRLVWFDRRRDGWLGLIRACSIGETVLWGWSKIKGCPEILGGPNKSNEKEPRLPSDSKALYLWPDRLCWYYWLFAVGIALPFLFSGQPSYNLVIAAFLVISTALIAPILIYRVCRIPVLDDLRKLPPLPKSMQQWFANQFSLTGRFPYIPISSKEFDSTLWLKASSRKSFIKLALAEFHQGHSEAGLGNEWNNRWFVRWGFYWCGPIWSSYLSLWLSLPWISPNYETQSVYAILLWLVMSAYLVLWQTRQFQAYTTLDEADRRMLAYPLLPHIGPPRAAEKLTQDTVKKLIYTLQAILVVFFLYALQIVPNSSEPPKPIEIKPCHGYWQCAWDWV